jgi:uncharacterized protein (DUF983 family)
MEFARAKRLLIRAGKLRCPECGLGPLYKSFFQMHESCSFCDLRFLREQGYFVGAIYLKVIATELFIFITYLTLAISLRDVDRIAYGVLFVEALVLPVLFNKHARSFWLCLDYLLDPPRYAAPYRRPH